MEAGPTALAEKFYGDFQAESQLLKDDIDRERTAISSGEQKASTDQYLTRLANLQKKVQDAAVYTSNHDQRIYAKGIKELQDMVEELRNLVKPKGKFSFKSARKATSKAVINHPEAILAPTKDGDSGVQTADSSLKNLLGNSSSRTTLENVTLSRESLQRAFAASINGVRQSVIDLVSRQEVAFSGLHVVDVRDSLILCGSIDGGLHVTDMQASVLVATTHQLRMHQCTNVVVYLAVGSSPIIENCTSVRFAPLPPEFEPVPGLTPNKWNDVLDFQYPGLSGSSPNWHELPESERAIFEFSSGQISIGQKNPSSMTDLQSLRMVLVAAGISEKFLQTPSTSGLLTSRIL